MQARTVCFSVLVLTAASGAAAQVCSPHFEAVGPGTSGPVASLAVHDEALIAGGLFADGSVLASWNGSTWGSLPAGIGGNAGDIVAALGVFKGTLYAGGFYSLAGSASAHTIATLDEGSWDLLVGGAAQSFGEVRRLMAHGSALYACGRFTDIFGASVHKVAQFNGVEWEPLEGGGTPAGFSINAMVFFDPDGDGPLPKSLIVAGDFTQIGSPTQVSAAYIARWTGSGWEPLGSGLSGPVNALAVFDDDGPTGAPPRLFAAGSFTAAGGQTATRIARWDGSSWSQVGVGPFQGLSGGTRGVLDLMVYDEDGPGPDRPVLYAAGDFTHAGGILPARGVARFNGVAWNSIGPFGAEGVTGGYVTSLMPFGDAIYLGGTFTAAGGVPALGIARWRTCHHCLADIAVAGTGAAGPDGFVTGEDFDLFVQAFFTAQRDAHGRLIADVATAGTGDPYSDAYITGEDFDLFVQSFYMGC